MSTTWTNVPKPSNTIVSSVASYSGGEPYGMLVAITQSEVSISSVATSIWTNVPKATGTAWTNVPKAT